MLRSVRILLIGWEILLVVASLVVLARGATWPPLLIACAVNIGSSRAMTAPDEARTTAVA